MHVRPLVMTKDEPMAWALMPAFLYRVYDFTCRHDPAMDAAAVCRDFEADFGSGAGRFFGLSLVDDEAQKVRGTLFAGIEIYRARYPYGMVYQWERDRGIEEPTELTHTCLQMLEGWARLHQLPRIRGLAETPSRVRLFRMVGFSEGPVIINKELSNGR